MTVIRSYSARSGRTYGHHPSASYVEGNTVRKYSRPEERGIPGSGHQILRNRERTLQMNLRYVVFLTAAAVLSVTMCVNYLKLQAESTALQKEATRLESSLNSLRLENDTKYNRIMSSVDLEQIREKAMEELGMVYAKSDQIETYDASGRDYVRQYMDVPDR